MLSSELFGVLKMEEKRTIDKEHDFSFISRPQSGLIFIIVFVHAFYIFKLPAYKRTPIKVYTFF